MVTGLTRPQTANRTGAARKSFSETLPRVTHKTTSDPAPFRLAPRLWTGEEEEGSPSGQHAGGNAGIGQSPSGVEEKR